MFYDMRQYLQPGSGTRFSVNTEAELWDSWDTSMPMMDQSQFEKDTNEIIVNAAKGDVLIAGLGIGLILLPIQEKEEVTSITIVELHQEVIDLISPYIPLHPKVTIVNDDIFTYIPDRTYDTIWVDIWTTAPEADIIQAAGGSISRDLIIDRLRPWLNVDGFAARWSDQI
jgi:hypothetical protein